MPLNVTHPCSHCGLPVPSHLLRDESALQFCCPGCEAVYDAINSCGLGAYYQKRQDLTDSERDLAAQSAKQAAIDTRYEHFDDQAFHDLHVTRDGASARIALYLEGVHCAACVWLLEKLPNVLDGVLESRLSFSDGLLELRWAPERVQLSTIAGTLHTLGYAPHPATHHDSNQLQRKEDRALLAKIGIAGAAFGNVMLFSLALYSAQAASGTLGSPTGLPASTMDADYHQFFRWAAFLVAVPAVLWCGSGFFRGALSALRTRTPHMDLPVSIGIAAALLWGTYGTLTASGEVYFDTVTMLVFLLLVGRWLQQRQSRAARSASDLMFALAPSTSQVVESGRVREVVTESVERGALVQVASGGRIGIDGVVAEGQSSVDESLLTGESRPRQVRVGDRVHAGTLNLSRRLLISAESTGHDTRLAALIAEVRAAAARKAPIAVLADRLSGYFTLGVLALSLLTFVAWLGSGAELAVSHSVALLIVTCPCALGLATPLAAAVALGRAARRGVLVKGMRFLEQLSKPALIVFDKTGTLTRGELRLVETHVLAAPPAAAPHSREKGSRPSASSGLHWAGLVRAAEQRSAHPIASALQHGLPLAPTYEVEDFEETPGFGVRARLRISAERSVNVQVGSARFAGRFASLAAGKQAARDYLARGLSPVFVVVDRQLHAVLGLGDPVRAEAKAALRTLRAMGHSLAIVSGDRTELVRQVAGQLGVNWAQLLGEQSPEQKLAFVERAAASGPVIMVGDGVNDAAALSAATVGLAVAGGAEASLAAADAFSTRAGLQPLVELIALSRRSMRVIHRNLAFSLCYNLVAAGLAMTGYISPLAAAILMPLSSLTVVFSSLSQGSHRNMEPIANVEPSQAGATSGARVEAA